MPFTPAQQKAYRLKRISLGLCTRCGCENKTEYEACKECRDEYNRKNNNRRKSYLVEGVCTGCGSKLPDAYNWRSCKECRAKYAEKERRRSKKRKSSNLCVRCGGILDGSGSYICVNCYMSTNEYKRIWEMQASNI